MALDEIAGSLRRIPLFSGLTPPQIAEIARLAGRSAFRPGDAIASAGEPADGAYLILSGEVVCRGEPGSRTPMEPVEPGSLVGELAMFIDHTYRSTVLAHGWTDCLKLERATLHAQMRADPDLAGRLAQAIQDRLALVAAELQLVDRLLLSAVEQCSMPAAVRALMPPGTPRQDSRPPGWPGDREAIGIRPPQKEKRPTPGEELGARSASCA
jgi:CRP-like cAMP-binding protein